MLNWLKRTERSVGSIVRLDRGDGAGARSDCVCVRRQGRPAGRRVCGSDCLFHYVVT